MINIVVYSIILFTSFLIVFTILAVVVRRFYMAKVYSALDAARSRFVNSADELISGAGPLTENYKQKPGSPGWQAVEESLFSALDRRPSDAARIHALFESLGYAEHYKNRLSGSSRWDRAMALDKLGRMRCAGAVPEIISALSSGHRDVRNMAVYALGVIKDARGLPYLIERLRNAAVNQEELSVRIMKSSIISFGEAAVGRLTAELKNPAWQIRSAAVDILGEIPSIKSAEGLRGALYDAEQDIRAKAAKGAGKLRDSESTGRLVELLKDRYWVVRLHAARALGHMGEPATMNEVKALLNDTNWQVRRVAGESLGMYGQAAWPALMEVCLLDEDRYAREQARDELERAGVVREIMGRLLGAEGKKEGASAGVYSEIISIMKGVERGRLREMVDASVGAEIGWMDVERALDGIKGAA